MTRSIGGVRFSIVSAIGHFLKRFGNGAVVQVRHVALNSEEKQIMALSPEQQSEIRERHSAVQSLSNGCSFPALKQDIARGTQIIDSLRGRLASDALRGYAYHAQLRAMVNAGNAQWEAQVSAALIARDQASAPLCARAAAVYKMFTHWNTLHENAYEFERMRGQIDAQVAEIQGALAEAEARLMAFYSEAKEALEQLTREVEAVEWSIAAAERAQLALPSGEHVFIACKAEWMNTGKKGHEPDGTLFVTDKRLIFEEADQGAPLLGLLGGKKKEGGVLWAVALPEIATMDEDREGLFGLKSVVTLRLGAGAPFPEIALSIKGGFGGERLLAYIKRAQTGALAPQSPGTRDADSG